MKFSFALLSPLALFRLVNCSGPMNLTTPIYMEVIKDAELVEDSEPVPAPSAPMEPIEDPSVPFFPPPKLAFLGLEKWSVIADRASKPFFFISNLEMKSKTLLKNARNVVHFGLHLEVEDIKLMKSLGNSPLLFQLKASKQTLEMLLGTILLPWFIACALKARPVQS